MSVSIIILMRNVLDEETDSSPEYENCFIQGCSGWMLVTNKSTFTWCQWFITSLLDMKNNWSHWMTFHYFVKCNQIYWVISLYVFDPFTNIMVYVASRYKLMVHCTMWACGRMSLWRKRAHRAPPTSAVTAFTRSRPADTKYHHLPNKVSRDKCYVVSTV